MKTKPKPFCFVVSATRGQVCKPVLCTKDWIRATQECDRMRKLGYKADVDGIY